ncbi:hypothetical protein ACICHK_21085 [Streptomyces sp. AHU1]|uniref:hypothetical protein n=1 Tax=Streptomyces sp. AHU1 TaxID=3377215 RepID=UPI003877FD9E
MPGLIRTSALAMALAGGVMLLTGCQDSAGAGSAADTPASSAAASASAADTPASSADTPASSADASAGAAVRTSAPARTASPASGSASTVKPSSGPATGAPARATAPAAAGCRNLAAGAEVKAEVTRTYRRDVTHFVHMGPAPGTFFYGRCGTVRYAAARFQPTAGATEAELVGLQDEGSVTKYFRDSGGGWVYVATDGLPVSPRGCGDIPAIPHALATAWRNCSIAP